MIIGNFYNIKSTNGLFYYGIDYLRENTLIVRKILVRSQLHSAAQLALPGCEILGCTTLQMLWETFRGALRGDLIYTPTSHPLPGISNQWIVVHDAYPFETGFKGRIKKTLLRLSLALSNCRVAYINKSEAQPFVSGLGVPAMRQLFAPNKFPATADYVSRHDRKAGDKLSVGLVGTDSAKKNYAALFAAAIDARSVGLFRFLVYGHRSAYYENLGLEYPEVEIELVQSDINSLSDFLAQIDALASVAILEGFGRPIAAALLDRVPCYLLARPVFKEFFDPGALFFDNEARLVSALALQASGENVLPSNYQPPAHIVQAYSQAVTILHASSLGAPH
jgi:hypothetical protein